MACGKQFAVLVVDKISEFQSLFQMRDEWLKTALGAFCPFFCLISA